MLRLILFLGFVLNCTTAYSQNDVAKLPIQIELKQLESQLIKAEDANRDRPVALRLIELSCAYADAFPADSLSADYLFKAADVSRGIGQYEQACQIWERVYQQYPEFEKAPQAQFLRAFTIENDLKNKEIARKEFQDFLKNHPDHPLSAQAKAFLEMPDMTDEELIRKFEKAPK